MKTTTEKTTVVESLEWLDQINKMISKSRCSVYAVYCPDGHYVNLSGKVPTFYARQILEVQILKVLPKNIRLISKIDVS